MNAPRSRTLVVWCPDWPAVAAIRQAGAPAHGPAAVLHANRVRACTEAARVEGVRIGQRRRDAQSRCPELLVAAVDEDRDGRFFEPVVAVVEELAPGVEILRPGLVGCRARGPVRYFGNEQAAAERIADVVEALDVECRVGIADALPVAVLAARRSTVVAPGRSAEFCAPLPISELSRDPAIAPPDRSRLTDLLVRLGITTAGAFAALPEEKVATRFGADAIVAHRLARGLAEREVSRRHIPRELAIEESCDPPLERVDAAAFLARALAERFHGRLAGAGLACTRLAITARTESGRQLSRVWRCARPLTPAATADRLRWQLDGWLTALAARGPGALGAGSDALGTDPPSGPGAITYLRLEPVEALAAGLVQYGLWGSDGADDQRAGWAYARVQGLLGPESVLAPVLSGGRGPADRITMVSWGEERTPARDPAGPWPGAIPAPSPVRLADPRENPVILRDAASRAVLLTGRGLLTASPATIHVTNAPANPEGGARVDLGARVDRWAGPWLLDERWWTRAGPGSGQQRNADGRRGVVGSAEPAAPAGLRARLQVVTAEGRALLLALCGEQWGIEGIYD